ncbi:hypothetical protein CCUS01_00085 [Colletotrichum cuscutae]|uniref:Uncharacterized protein n=1 Tax=Colletotrichum cuscutae TaxID=1209917 RepID=A0AAI9YDT1_9PEZI|nr:hypothetical protein CCUS01_00085 [Colletotrichum cuscutae]
MEYDLLLIELTICRLLEAIWNQKAKWWNPRVPGKRFLETGTNDRTVSKFTHRIFMPFPRFSPSAIEPQMHYIKRLKNKSHSDLGSAAKRINKSEKSENRQSGRLGRDDYCVRACAPSIGISISLAEAPPTLWARQTTGGGGRQAARAIDEIKKPSHYTVPLESSRPLSRFRGSSELLKTVYWTFATDDDPPEHHLEKIRVTVSYSGGIADYGNDQFIEMILNLILPSGGLASSSSFSWPVKEISAGTGKGDIETQSESEKPYFMFPWCLGPNLFSSNSGQLCKCQ